MLSTLAPLLLFLASQCATQQLLPNFEGPIAPWLQPPSWQPVYGNLFNDLPALLESRASPEKWVSLFCFSLPANRTHDAEEESFFRLALNTLYSYRIFGKASSDIVAALSPEALAECRRLRLPCLNATRYTDKLSYKLFGWAKVKLSLDVLKLGYNVHLSDLDVSYLKPIGPAMKEIFSWTNGAADGSMMAEDWVHQDNPADASTRRPIYLANLGVVFLRANSRSLGFLEALLKWANDQNQDQYMVTLISYQAWAPCQDEVTCLAIRARGMAAITLHPGQFVRSNCQPEPQFDPCSPRRLYVHAVCRATSRDKEAFLRYLRAVFITGSGSSGIGGGVAGGAGSGEGAAAAAGAWEPMAIGQQDNVAIAASGLPCPAAQQRAWRRAPGDYDYGGGGGGGGGGKAAGGSSNTRLRGRARRLDGKG